MIYSINLLYLSRLCMAFLFIAFNGKNMINKINILSKK
jgi:hypothetical protein